MAQLIVRGVDERVARALKRRAAAHGRSAEAEHREILRQALLSSGEDFKKLLLAMPAVGEDSDFERHDDLGREVDL
jgi:plasmid stability protein